MLLDFAGNELFLAYLSSNIEAMSELRLDSMPTPLLSPEKATLPLPQIHSCWVAALSLAPTARVIAIRRLLFLLPASQQLPRAYLVPLHLSLALTHAFLGEHYLSTLAFANALRYDSSSVIAWYGLGLAHAKMGDWKLAKYSFTKMLRCSDPLVWQAIRYEVFRSAKIETDGAVEKGEWVLTRSTVKRHWHAASSASRDLDLERCNPVSGGSELHGVGDGILFGPGWDAPQSILDAVAVPGMNLHVQYKTRTSPTRPNTILSPSVDLTPKPATSAIIGNFYIDTDSNELENSMTSQRAFEDATSKHENASTLFSDFTAGLVLDSNHEPTPFQRDFPDNDDTPPALFGSIPIQLDPSLVPDSNDGAASSEEKVWDGLDYYFSPLSDGVEMAFDSAETTCDRTTTQKRNFIQSRTPLRVNAPTSSISSNTSLDPESDLES